MYVTFVCSRCQARIHKRWQHPAPSLTVCCWSCFRAVTVFASDIPAVWSFILSAR